MSHEQTRTNKIHHGPDLGETTTFLLIVYSVPLHESTRPTSKWLFVLGLPSQSPKIAKVKTPATLEAHNFVCKPSIVMRFKETL